MKTEGTIRFKDRTNIAELVADERCSQAILDFLATTVVGRTAGPLVAEEEAGSKASEWELRERGGQLAEEEESAQGGGL